MKKGRLRVGTCSWNYASWVGQVYTAAKKRSADYLPEYSRKYDTAEIDSWFYRMPEKTSAAEYFSLTGENFIFTCKVPRELTLVHLRNPDGKTFTSNPAFLSKEYFTEFTERCSPLKGKIGAVMLEFEYLNKTKMKGLDAFIGFLDRFLSGLPQDIPVAIECRNGNYLNEEYFSFLKSRNAAHVFSQKQYMPDITELYGRYSSLLTEMSVIRLLGGDRQEIEKITGEQWNRIVMEKPEKKEVAEMINDMTSGGKDVFLNVNNHYEGSSPLTIESMLPYFRCLIH